MEANHRIYDPDASDQRIRDILDASDQNYIDSKEIPSIDELTYKNGYYVDVTAVMIDIRGSSDLPDKHTRPVLGKIYRAYISECVAIINSNSDCRQLFIEGDAVIGVFNTPNKTDVDTVFNTAYSLNSQIKHLNYRLSKKGYSTLTCGIGIHDGNALVIKAGYNGSGINEIVWLGRVINKTAELCHNGNRGMNDPIQVSTRVYDLLNDHNKSLLKPVMDGFWNVTHYQGDVISSSMQKWFDTNCK